MDRATQPTPSRRLCGGTEGQAASRASHPPGNSAAPRRPGTRHLPSTRPCAPPGAATPPASADPDGDGGHLDPGRPRHHRRRRSGVQGQHVHHEHDRCDGPGAGHRLLAVHRLAPARGAPSRQFDARGDPHRRRHGDPRGRLQRHRLHPRDARDAARPRHDAAQPRLRRRRRRAGLDRSGPDVPSGAPDGPRRPSRSSARAVARALRRRFGRRGRTDPAPRGAQPHPRTVVGDRRHARRDRPRRRVHRSPDHRPAAIIIVVFSGFATGQLVAFREMGFGIAVRSRSTPRSCASC